MKSNKKSKVLILDGGGSSLKVFVQNESGLKLKAKYNGNFNVQSGKRKEIMRTLSKVIKRFPTETVKIGLAGIVTKKDKNLLVKSLVGRKVSVMSDVDLAVDIHLQNADGMMAILGTGSIFVAKVGRRKIKVGGYGRVIGDAGSGYAIGQEAVQAYLQLLDGLEHDTVFESAMKKFFRTKQEAVRKVYQEQFELQHLAPVVFECAVQGSTVAKKIIDYQTSLVVRYIQALRQRSGKELPLYLIGGLIEQETCYATMLKEKLKHYNINIQHHDGLS